MKIKRFVIAVTVAGVLCGMVACAPKPAVVEPGGDDPTPSVEVAWSMDVDCGICHTAEATSVKNVACLAKAHADLNYGCTDCHTDATALAKAHENSSTGTPAGKLKRTDVSEETCLACHESKEVLAQKTADVMLSDGTRDVNPHALPSSKDHDGLPCTDCHVSHVQSNALDEAKGTCLSCHHSGVFECGTCHT